MAEFDKKLFQRAVKIICEEEDGANDDARAYLVIDLYVELSSDSEDKNLLYKQVSDYLNNDLFLNIFKDEFNDIKQDNLRLMKNVKLDNNNLSTLDNIISSCNELKQLINNNIFEDQIMTKDNKPIAFDELLKATNDPYQVY